MSKSILSLSKDIQKREHRDSPLGLMERELWKFYDNSDNRKYFEAEEGQLNPNARWVDIHRATTRSKQTDLEDAFTKEFDALQDKYRVLTNDLLLEAMTKERDYLLALHNE